MSAPTSRTRSADVLARVPPDVRIWRRGAAPRPAGPGDYGYFGPRSVIWQILVHPVTPLVAGQTTLLLEAAHRHMQAVLMGHDPTLRAAIDGRGSARQSTRRVQRTVGVPVPMILGDTPTADGIAEHLRAMHARMSGIVPGTERELYSAGSPELGVFAHTTIFHAFLRTYEALAFRDGRPPARLPDPDRDRYFRELVPFAELMGVPSAMIPDSASAVAEYYKTIASDYGPLPGWRKVRPAVLRASLRPADWRDARHVAANTVLNASAVVALAVVPKPVRRQHGVSPLLDPILAATLIAAQPSFAALTIPAIGDRVIRNLSGPEGLALVHAARKTMASHRPGSASLPRAA
jgi:uncharacterized protein (DUF2236 family)